MSIETAPVDRWAELFDYAWPGATTAVYVLVVAVLAVLLRHRQVMWHRAIPSLRLFALSQLGMLGAAAVHGAIAHAAVADELRQAFILLEGLAVIGLVGRVIFGVFLVRFHAPRILEDVVLVVGYGIWALICLRRSGVEVMGVVATSAVITGVLAFAMQDTLGNVLGGLALQFDRSLQIGQWIRIDDVAGRVSQIRWRSTTIETLDWETVIVPNSFLVKSRFRVLGLDNGAGLFWRRSVEFDADSDFAADHVIGVAHLALQSAEIPGVVAHPAPTCIMTGVGVGLGHYSLHYWIADVAAVETVKSAVLQHLTVAMERAAIRLYAPTLASVVVTGTRRADQTTAGVVHGGRLQALKSMELFDSLDAAELESLVPHLSRAPFATGDVLLKQGATPRWLFLLTRGQVDLVVDEPGQPRQLITTLSAPSLLGEPGMVSGTPRGGSAIARTGVECYLLDKAGFAEALRNKPELTRLLAERIGTLADLRSSIAIRAGSEPLVLPADTNRDLLSKVSRFFGLKMH